MSESFSPETTKRLRELLSKPVFQDGMKPFKKGVILALKVDADGPYTLERTAEGTLVLETKPERPELTFSIPTKAIDALSEFKTDDVGEMGIEVIKLMMHSDPSHRISARVHIGLFEMLRNGYFSVLAGGGPTVMKYLASKGFSSISKIKEAISKFKD